MKNEIMQLFKLMIIYAFVAGLASIARAQTLNDLTSNAKTPRQAIILKLLEISPGAPSRENELSEGTVYTTLTDDAADQNFTEAPIAQERVVVALPQVNEAVDHMNSASNEVLGPVEGRSGFFHTAADYLKSRGGIEETSSQITLTYQVTRQDKKTEIALDPETVIIIIGPDFAMIKRGDKATRLYDFKLRRMITLGTDSFTNTSLFGARYNDINTVQRMTQNGQKRAIDVKSTTLTSKALGPAMPGAKQSLDAFYLESSLSWAAAALPKQDFMTLKSDKAIEAIYKGETVFSANLNGPDFDLETQSYNFIALLFNEAPIHPDILASFRGLKLAPTQMVIETASPNFPTGQIQIWRLSDTVSQEKDFPLTESYQSVAELKGADPLAFVITEAVYGRALQGPPAPEATLAAMRTRLDNGDVLTVWLSALSLADKVGGCEALLGLCELINRARDGGRDDLDVQELFQAFDDIKTPNMRINGLKTLAPLLTDPDTPSLILQRVATALIKLKPSAIKYAELSHLNAESLLKEAIAKDPYDYVSYKSLAQLYAAQGRFAESWDIADSLRAFPYAPETLKASFDRAEAKLLRGAPGYFPPIKP